MKFKKNMSLLLPVSHEATHNKAVKLAPGLRPCAGRLATPAAPYLKRYV